LTIRQRGGITRADITRNRAFRGRQTDEELADGTDFPDISRWQ
jgi:hypothetical protein